MLPGKESNSFIEEVMLVLECLKYSKAVFAKLRRGGPFKQK